MGIFQKKRTAWKNQFDDFEAQNFMAIRGSLDNANDVRKVSNDELFKIQCEWEYIHAGRYGAMGFHDLLDGECGILNGKIIVLGDADGT